MIQMEFPKSFLVTRQIAGAFSRKML